MLWIASQQFNRFRNTIETISGVVFLATPHMTNRNASSTQALSQILRSDLRSNTKKLFTNADLSTIEYISLRFEELKLQIPILSCHETQPTKLKSFWTSRRVIVSAYCGKLFPSPKLIIFSACWSRTHKNICPKRKYCWHRYRPIEHHGQ